MSARDVVITGIQGVCRQHVDLTFGDVPLDGEVHRGDVVLHGPQVRTRRHDLRDEISGRAGRESAVRIGGVRVVQAAQSRRVTTEGIDPCAIQTLAAIQPASRPFAEMTGFK